MKPKILIVDDEELIRWSLSRDLCAAGYAVQAAESARGALDAIEAQIPDLVLSDVRLGGTGGLDLLRRLRREHPDMPVLLMTAFAEVSSAVEALREGAADYILKPLQLDALKVTLRRALETSSLKRRIAESGRRHRNRYNFECVVARSPAMRKAVEDARKMAASQGATVLLLGESGTGKDLLARAIHYESARGREPFMEISCTAIPEDLLESELFGYEKGAFTGAAARKEGLLELASGGTVFLNEIGHMPPGLQAKLLRFLEDKSFRRVGGREDLTVDVRVLSATNENLEEAVARRRFREDLYYRLNVLSLRLLPLRQRPEDIPGLIDALLERLSADLGKPKPVLPEALRRSILEYPWPGNVRELRNALERMMILGELELPKPRGEAAADGALPGFVFPEQGVRLEEVERELVRLAVEKCDGNQTRAAQLLGLGRDALRRRLEKFEFKLAEKA